MGNEHEIRRAFHALMPKGPDCWLWQGSRNDAGYGRVSINGRMWMAHRASYVLFVGSIPVGLVVRHKCDVPQCVRPGHLELGTHKDNMRDKMKRGRWRGNTSRRRHGLWVPA
jgi:hypothetical protein